MARPVGDVGNVRTQQRPENYGQTRSALAHAVNDLRKAQRTGDAEALLRATTELASTLKIDLGATEGKTGAELLKALGEKLGLDPAKITAESLQDVTRTATDHTRLLGLVNSIE